MMVMAHIILDSDILLLCLMMLMPNLAELGTDANITLGPLSFDDFIPGWRTVCIKDPEGNIVEISQGYTDEK